MKQIGFILGQPQLVLKERQKRADALPVFGDGFSAAVPHEKQPEQLRLILGEADVAHAAGLIGGILAGGHGGGNCLLIQLVGCNQNGLLDFLHIGKQTEDRLGGGSEMAGKGTGGQGGKTLLPGDGNGSGDNLLPGKAEFGRHRQDTSNKETDIAQHALLYKDNKLQWECQ